MLVVDSQQQGEVIDFRETAPSRAERDMFEGQSEKARWVCMMNHIIVNCSLLYSHGIVGKSRFQSQNLDFDSEVRILDSPLFNNIILLVKEFCLSKSENRFCDYATVKS